MRIRGESAGQALRPAGDRGPECRGHRALRGVTTSLEGASAFAYRAIAVPLEVRAIDAAGQPLATGTTG